MLAHEARAANVVKSSLAATAVLGNPPYALKSSNLQEAHRALVEPYKFVNGIRIREKGALQFEKNINDDYVKFFRLCELRIAKSGAGVLALITNHTFLENSTLRGMRASLLNTFNALDFLDLNGNSNRQERLPDGSVDENVFEIKQGVAISILRRNGQATRRVSRGDIKGSQSLKYEYLLRSGLHDLLRQANFVPIPTNYRFMVAEQGGDNYEHFHPLDSIFLQSGAGFISARDNLVLDFDREQLVNRIEGLKRFNGTDQELCEEFGISNKKGWDIAGARVSLKSTKVSESIVSCSYRPFDTRWIFFDGAWVWGRSWPTSKHILGEPKNIALVTVKQIAEAEGFSHCLVVNSPADNRFTFSSRGVALQFPMLLLGGDSNVSESFLDAIKRSTQSGSNPKSVDAFAYVYAVLHSAKYRTDYSARLRLGFASIPIPRSRICFDELAAIGLELIDHHLAPTSAIGLNGEPTRFAPSEGVSFFGKDRAVRHVSSLEFRGDRSAADCQSGEVRVNETSGFTGVHERIWSHRVGGYQVLHKWLEDRRKAGRSLSDDDIAHWRRIYAALQATQKLMLQVDEVIERHGGWPTGPGEGGAFSLDHPPPSADVLAAQAAARPRGRRRAVQPGQQSLLGGDDDPEPAPARPTPAAPAVRMNGEDLDDGEMMCAMRATLAQAADALPRDDLIRAAARAMGYARTSARLADALDDAIRRAVRRGIATNERAALTLAARSIEDYERDALKAQVLAVVRAQRAWVPREDVPRLLARWLGFGRTGGRIVEATESVLRSLVRAGELQAQDGAVRPA